MSRRSFLRTGAAGAAMITAGFPARSVLAESRPRFETRPWALGVASGDPAPDGVVLWTRLAVDPLGVEPLPAKRIEVRYELAADESFRRIVDKGTAIANGDNAHSVHVEVDGLRPHHDYWYRFAAGDEISPVGRTRTAPGPGSAPNALSFAVASCQQYEHGYYTAWRHVAEEDLDLVLHVGDYIYEHATDVYVAPEGNVRHHVGGEIVSLFDYRRRHAQYRSDPDLQAAHAAHPFVVTWDDHEVDNNYADLISENNDPIAEFRARRAAAYKAYWEHMPLRRNRRAKGPDMPLYRVLPYGDLAQFVVLDTRQYRSDQACGDGTKPVCEGWDDPARTFLGDEQERTVGTALRCSRARWNVIANQIPLTAIDQRAGEGLSLYMDGWSGYPVARERFLEQLERVSNPLVVTGDVHSSWACEVNKDVRDPASESVAVELIGTSISSTGNGHDNPHPVEPDNPQVKFYRRRRGYVRVQMGSSEARADYRHLAYVQPAGAPVYTDHSFVIPDGEPVLN
jgi:alkaline phosphatase D